MIHLRFQSNSDYYQNQLYTWVQILIDVTHLLQQLLNRKNAYNCYTVMCIFPVARNYAHNSIDSKLIHFEDNFPHNKCLLKIVYNIFATTCA